MEYNKNKSMQYDQAEMSDFSKFEMSKLEHQDEENSSDSADRYKFNLSMDELRQSLDDYEKILRS